jgi:uncharacterized membrane protein
VLVAAYLTYVHYAGVVPVCAGGGGGCERVQASSWSKLAGVPVALIGLGGYLAILAAMAARGEAAVMAAAAMSLVGAGFSGYLTYLELFEIDAICQWCVVSALLMAALAIVGVLRLLHV